MTAPMIPMMRSPIIPPGPSPGTTFLASHPAMIPTIIHERILISLIPPSELTDPWLLPVYRKTQQHESDQLSGNTWGLRPRCRAGVYDTRVQEIAESGA